MSNDSFIREVNEELRQDRARAVFDRYGMAALGVALVIVLATGIYVAYQYWTGEQANASGGQFSRALTLANQGNDEEAQALLSELEAEGYGAYPVLARLRSGTVSAEAGDPAAAVASFDAVANDASIPQAIRDTARLRAAYLLVDHGSFDDVATRVEALTADDNPMRHSAREAMGLAAWKAGDTEEALRLFDLLADDPAVSGGMGQRVELMRELIRGGQGAS